MEYNMKVLIFIFMQLLELASYAFSHDLKSAKYYYDSRTYNPMEVKAVGGQGADDTSALLDLWSTACQSSGAATVEVPASKTFRVKSIQFDGGNCKFSSVNFMIKGGIVKSGVADCEPYWLSFTNINGLKINGNGLIDGQGQSYWNKANGGCEKAPATLEIDGCRNVALDHVNTKDSPGIHIHVKKCTDVQISNVHITAPATSPNTDGINIRGSQRVTIRDSFIGTGDDCVAINDGCQFVNVTNVQCGPGHGISVGSLGKDKSHETVEDVHITGCHFTGSTNGARIKTAVGGSGYAKRITYQGITLDNTENPIIIDQSYCPHGQCVSQGNSAVQISDISFIDFHGKAANEEAIQLNCVSATGCTNIVMNNINIQSNTGKPAVAVCKKVQGVETETSPSVSCLKSE